VKVEEDGEVNNRRSASAQGEERRKRLCGVGHEWLWSLWNSLELRRKENIRKRWGAALARVKN
jgi:hypothetical protein